MNLSLLGALPGNPLALLLAIGSTYKLPIPMLASSVLNSYGVDVLRSRLNSHPGMFSPAAVSPVTTTVLVAAEAESEIDSAAANNAPTTAATTLPVSGRRL